MYKFYEQYLITLRNKHKYRKLSNIRQEKLAHKLLDFSTNDYLNLSKNQSLVQALNEASQIYGVGATGSRLLCGNNNLFEMFEKQIALDKNTEASLIFNSGFQANISSLSCLLDNIILGRQPIVFFDKLNHASLYKAVFLSKSELLRYKHNNIDHLEFLLKKYKNDNRAKFIVTETVFGMDGDIAPLQEIADLARDYNAFLYLDEAHSTGVFGTKGYGLASDLNLEKLNYVIMGTFSKAIGVSGGYIASSKLICDYMVNRADGFIYSTAPSPGVIGAAFKSWQMLKDLKEERQHLVELGEILRSQLVENNFEIGNSKTHIIPVIIGGEEKSLNIQKALLDKNILVSCVRPPTVLPNSSRLRIALNAGHSLSDINYLVETLIKVML